MIYVVFCNLACFQGSSMLQHMSVLHSFLWSNNIPLYDFNTFYLFILFFFFEPSFSLYLFILFIILWLCWVFVSVRGLSLVAASGSHSSLRCAGLSLSWPLLLRSTGSVVVAHGPSCSVACGILPDQGSNPCPLHQQADSQPLHHQGSPYLFILHEQLGCFQLFDCCD